MAQQQLVTMPNGSVYEWDEFDLEYRCIHDEINIETVEVDTMSNGEHDTYETKIAVCANDQCDITIEDYDFNDEEDSHDPDY